MLLVFILTAFFIGVSVGSFVNVLVFRWHHGLSIRGRSQCVNCKVKLPAKDLIPVLSFILLKGKCRSCKRPIGKHYLLVELAAGVLFVLAFVSQTNDTSLFSALDVLTLFRFWIFSGVLLTVFLYDYWYGIIPDRVTFPAMGVALGLNILAGQSIYTLIGAGIFGAAFFGAQYVISKGQWIGGGDIRLGALMGFMLGWPLVVLAIFIAYIIGAVVAIFVLAMKKRGWKSAIPFGPFLTVSTLIVFYIGQFIVDWYLALIRL